VVSLAVAVLLFVVVIVDQGDEELRPDLIATSALVPVSVSSGPTGCDAAAIPGGDLAGAMKDNLDSSFMRGPSAETCFARFNMGDLPANAESISEVRVFGRLSAFSTVYGQASLGGAAMTEMALYGSTVTQDQSAVFTRPGGGAWTVLDVNQLQVALLLYPFCDEYGTCGPSGDFASEMYVGVTYSENAAPTTLTTVTTTPEGTATTTPNTAASTCGVAAPPPGPQLLDLVPTNTYRVTDPANDQPWVYATADNIYPTGKRSFSPGGAPIDRASWRQTLVVPFTLSEPATVSIMGYVDNQLRGGRYRYDSAGWSGLNTINTCANNFSWYFPHGNIALPAGDHTVYIQATTWDSDDGPAGDKRDLYLDTLRASAGTITGFQTEALPAANPACNDGLDNDGNGWRDYPADAGCSSGIDTTEAGGAGVTGSANTADGGGYTAPTTTTTVPGGPASTVAGGRPAPPPGVGDGGKESGGSCEGISWNPSSWGNIIPCGISKLFNSLFEFLRWIVSSVEFMLVPKDLNFFAGLKDEWNAGLGSIIGRPVAVVGAGWLALRPDGAGSCGGPTVTIPGGPGWGGFSFQPLTACDGPAATVAGLVRPILVVLQWMAVAMASARIIGLSLGIQLPGGGHD